ncbi:MAP kinase kinase kinase Ste11 [Aspergillus luchuensis]|uniref:MAP kinase kinase kinase Ste11 n=1 Tax=Aspergillus kawachii TaxID=1069201 RepID=A0A146F9F7_ASPKA|nr:MAP kinase kinase kinase Ste11 [Aspergillus luchuensis]
METGGAPSCLPPPRRDQIYVVVHPIDSGQITLPERYFLSPSDPIAREGTELKVVMAHDVQWWKNLRYTCGVPPTAIYMLKFDFVALIALKAPIGLI